MTDDDKTIENDSIEDALNPLDEDIVQSPKALVHSDDVLPEQIPIVPVFDRPFFPAQIQAVVVSRSRW